MNRIIFLISIMFLGLTFAGCKKANHRSGNSDATINTLEDRDGAEEEQTANKPAKIYAKPEVPILCYHRIADGKKGDYTVSPATFAAHMRILSDSGYHSISPAQLYDYLVYDKALPEKPVMITFDDSREEHATIAAPVMEKFGFRGVFFIMTITYNKKNYMSEDQIARLAKAGHTIGLHTWDHTMVTKYRDASDWEKQIVEPKEKLEKIVGRDVEYFAYPNGVYDKNSARKLSKYFKLSFTLSTKRDSTLPLQTVRRMIVPEWTALGLVKSIKRSFRKH